MEGMEGWRVVFHFHIEIYKNKFLFIKKKNREFIIGLKRPSNPPYLH